MSDKIFLDSNILVYCYSTSDARKQGIARTLSALDNATVLNLFKRTSWWWWMLLPGILKSLDSGKNEDEKI